MEKWKYSSTILETTGPLACMDAVEQKIISYLMCADTVSKSTDLPYGNLLCRM
jgi:hypothetical protein